MTPASPVPVNVPGYEMLGLLGRGGMGVVYKARHSALKRMVALKMILHAEHAGPEQHDRFMREAEAVARLRHPNIVQIYEIGEAGGLPYFSLEFVDGGSLDQRLCGKPLPGAEAALLVEVVARAIHAAHEAGIVHRDLKPANVLLTADGSPRITDFGLAKTLGEAGQTAPGAVMGTPSYMAPEQAEGRVREVGPRTDVYALGAILYECLTGRPPFRAATLPETLRQVVEADPIPPRQLNPDCPRDLDTICLKCLRKDPGRRYPSAGELERDLRRFLNGEPIAARPAGRVERLRRWSVRNPALAATVGLAVVVLVAVSAFAVVFAIYQQQTADQFQREREEIADRLKDTEEQLTKSRADRAGEEARRLAAERATAAGLQLKEGQGLCERGETSAGLLHLARALELVPADAADLQRAIRTNLGVWADPKRMLRGVIKPEKAPLASDTVVTAATFTPDGRRILVATQDHFEKVPQVCVWDAAARKMARQPLHYPCEARFAILSPHSRYALFVGNDESARLGDAETGKLIGAPIPVGVCDRDNFAFSPDNRYFLMRTEDTVRVWDTRTATLAAPPFRPEEGVGFASFSPDGKSVLIFKGKNMEVWETATGKRVGPPLVVAGGLGSSGGVAFSPSGNVALQYFESPGTLFDWLSGKELARIDCKSPAAFASDGKTFFAAEPDKDRREVAKDVRVYETATGKSVGLPLQHTARVDEIVPGPGDRQVLTLSSDHVVWRWDLAGDRPVKRRIGDRGWPMISPDGKTVMMNREEGVQFWNAVTAEAIAPVQKSVYTESLTNLFIFSPDGKRVLQLSDYFHSSMVQFAKVAVPGENRDPVQANFRVWDATMGKPLGEVGGIPGHVHTLAFRKDSNQVLVVRDSPGTTTLRYWEVDSGRPAENPLTVDSALAEAGGRWVFAVQGLGFNRDGSRLLAAGATQSQVLEAATGKFIGPPLMGIYTPTGLPRTVALGPDGTTVAGSGPDVAAVRKVWDARAGNLAGSPPPGAEVMLPPRVSPPRPEATRLPVVVFSPDGKTILASPQGFPAQVQLHDALTHQPKGPALPHRGDVLAAAFLADGQTVVTACRDGGEVLSQVWDPRTGRSLGPPARQDEECDSLVFSADGKHVLTNRAGNIRLWDRAAGKPLGPPLQAPAPARVARPEQLLQVAFRSALAFSPDGRTAMTGGQGEPLRFWNIPLPLEAETERIVLWVQTMTGKEMDTAGAIHPLTASTLESRRQRLRELGGPPIR